MKRLGVFGFRWVVALALLAEFPHRLAADARNVRFENLSLDQGLSQTSVNCIIQDSRGFMWFGTQEGLNRYDGHAFTVYKHDPLDPNSLSNDTVWAIHEDTAGFVWVGTDGGLDRWSRNTETFSHFRNDPGKSDTLVNDRVRVVYETRDGVLWIGTDGGLARFHRREGTFTRLFDDGTTPIHRVRSIAEDQAGSLWIGTDGEGLVRFDRSRGTVKAYRHAENDDRSLSHDRVRVVFEDRYGVLWIGTYEGGLNRFDRDTETFDRFVHDPREPGSLSENRVRAISQDKAGVLWIGTGGGLNEWRPDHEEFISYRHNPSDPASLSDNRVMSIYQDRGGVFWVGTQGGGINKWNTATASFGLFRVDPSAPSTLTSNAVTAFATDKDGILWIGTYEGLNRLDRKTGEFTSYRHDAGRPGSLSDDRVMSILLDRRGVLWVGTFEGGLDRFNPVNETFDHFRHDPKSPASLSGNGVTCIHEDRGGRLWVGVYRGGLNRLDAAGRTFVHYRHDPRLPTSLSDDSVLTIREDSQGTIWIGTETGGLNRFDASRDRFTRFAHDASDPNSLTSGAVFSIHEDRSGVFWVGTQGGGLNRWEPSDRRAGRATFRHLTERNRLPNNTIYGILEDEDGDLWLSTNRGLARVRARTGEVRAYDASQGLQSNEFNFGAYHRSSAGEMFFGGNGGFNAFFPALIRINTMIPPVVLTSFSKLNQNVKLKTQISETREIELGYEDYVVSFEFAALDYAAPQKNRYAYKLVGLDKDWTELPGTRRATYTNLAPGHYVFRVKGSNSDGVWNESGVSLGVTVIPPPWRTWWAKSSYALLALGMVLAVRRAHVGKLRREATYSHMLEEQVKERTAELAQRNEELQIANRKLEDASTTDSLTGLGNRRFLTRCIEKEISTVERSYETPGPNGRPADLVLMMIDLDGLKAINDTYGHSAGDMALIQMRELLENSCRRADMILRWGGDEFLVVGRYADRDVAKKLAERIRKSVEEHEFNLGLERPVHLSASIGFAFYPFIPSAPTRITWEQVVTIADRALYGAKASGRNAWVGIFSTRATPLDAVHLINHMPDLLALEKRIAVQSSFSDREIAWSSPNSERAATAPILTR